MHHLYLKWKMVIDVVCVYLVFSCRLGRSGRSVGFVGMHNVHSTRYNIAAELHMVLIVLYKLLRSSRDIRSFCS